MVIPAACARLWYVWYIDKELLLSHISETHTFPLTTHNVFIIAERMRGYGWKGENFLAGGGRLSLGKI